MVWIDSAREAVYSGHRASDILRDTFHDVAKLYCPHSYGFEGPETYEDCGECIVCIAKELTKENAEVLVDETSLNIGDFYKSNNGNVWMVVGRDSQYLGNIFDGTFDKDKVGQSSTKRVVGAKVTKLDRRTVIEKLPSDYDFPIVEKV